MVTQQAHQIGKDEVADPPDQGHLAVRTRHPRADHEISIGCDSLLTELGKKLGRIGAVSIQKTEEIPLCHAKPGLERCAVSPIGGMGDAADLRIAGAYLGSPVPGTIVHDNEFKIADSDFSEARLDGENALDDVCDSAFFVQSRDDD